MPQFHQRSLQEELMDDLNCSGPVLDQTLSELDFINRVLGGNDVVFSGLKQLILSKKSAKKEIHIVDLGCGGGGILKLIADWATKKNITVSLTGVDANPHVIQYAESNCRDYNNIHFQVSDVLTKRFYQQEFDIAIATLFFHHFTNEQLGWLFYELFRISKIGILVNDLHRHWLAYHSIKLLTKVLSRSEMVKNDAPVSVLRGFSQDELKQILSNSGIHSYDLKWKWAFRWQLLAYHLNE